MPFNDKATETANADLHLGPWIASGASAYPATSTCSPGNGVRE